MSNQLNEEDLMKQTMQQLCDWVLDGGKIVTCSYLLKNTALSVEQVQILLKQFVDQNITDGRVNSTFLLMGEMKPEYNQVDDIERLRSTICKQEKLEQTKLQFKSIDTCSIYSVQAKPIRDFQSLFNVNWSMEGSPYLSPVKNKSLVWNSAAYDFYIRWKESRQDDVKRLENMTKHVTASKEMLRNATKVDDRATTSNDKAGEGKATYKFFKNEGKASPEKKKIEVIDASASSPQIKRRRKVLIDNEEYEDEEEGHMDTEKHAYQYNSMQPQQDMETKKSTSPSHPMNFIGNGADDLYCTGGDSSPEKEAPQIDHVQPSKSKTSKSKRPSQGTKKLQQLLAKTEVLSDEEDEIMPSVQAGDAGEPEDHQSKTITTFRREKVTDTYVDEDGFTVTRTLPRLVETEEVVAVRPSSQKPVLKSSNTVNLKPSKSKVAPGQPTISSFFTKK